MPREAIRKISDLKVWSVLLSPVRFELLEAMRSLAPCSIADLANTLVRPADALYRHMELLQEGGYVVPAGFRKVGRHTEQLFDLTANDFHLDLSTDPTGEAALQMLVDTAKTTFKSAEKILLESANAHALKFSPSERNLLLAYELAWLSDEEFAQVIHHLRQVKKITDNRTRRPAIGDKAGANPSDPGKLYAILALATPVTRRRRPRNKHKTPETPPAGKKKKLSNDNTRL